MPPRHQRDEHIEKRQSGILTEDMDPRRTTHRDNINDDREHMTLIVEETTMQLPTFNYDKTLPVSDILDDIDDNPNACGHGSALREHADCHRNAVEFYDLSLCLRNRIPGTHTVPAPIVSSLVGFKLMLSNFFWAKLAQVGGLRLQDSHYQG
jgi:hypothetical protein